MTKSDLIHTLREHGMEQSAIRDLFLFYLNTEDRQLQLFEWIQSHSGVCTPEQIMKQAQEILSGFLAGNPYNSSSKNRSIPKWTPPPPPPPQEPESLPVEAQVPGEEDPFDKVLQSFFASLDDWGVQ